MSLPRGQLIITSGVGTVSAVPAGSNNQILVIDTNQADIISYKNTYKKYFSAYDSAGGINLNSGFTPITWDTEDYKDTDYYTHSADSSEITILKAATYKISVNISANTGLSLTQALCTFRAELDTGSGYSVVGGTTRVINLGTIATGAGSAPINKIATLGVGDKLRITAERTTGSGTVTTTAAGCSIIIETI